MRAFLSLKGVVGGILVAVFTLVAIVAPYAIPANQATKINILARLHAPSAGHLFGTDQLGRELVWRVLLGAHTSLVIAVAAVILSILIGLPIGVLADYYRGWTDHALMRLVETLLSFPALLLALTISAVLGPNERNAILAIGIAFSPYLARIVRLHVLPNIMAPLIVQATISVAFAILAEAGLSFLGLGTQPPSPPGA